MNTPVAKNPPVEYAHSRVMNKVTGEVYSVRSFNHHDPTRTRTEWSTTVLYNENNDKLSMTSGIPNCTRVHTEFVNDWVNNLFLEP